MTDLEVKTDKQETLVELRCKVAALESAISAKDAILNIIRPVNGFDPILSNHDAVYIDDPPSKLSKLQSSNCSNVLDQTVEFYDGLFLNRTLMFIFALKNQLCGY